jgi:rfaE bifunctional protein kinase chain/domain
MNINPIRLRRVVRAFHGKTIGVLGDFMLDEVLRGRATRLSPEAPVPVVLMDSNRKPAAYAGGAGNVVANIVALGGRAIPFGALGADPSGRELRRLLRRQGVSCETLINERNRVTPRKLRIAAHQHQLLRLDFEEPCPLSPRIANRLQEEFARRARKLDALIISDYRKGSTPASLCAGITALARQRRIPVLVDPKPEHPEICRHATIATPNLQEAELIAGLAMRDSSSLEAGGKRLLAELNCLNLLITRGADGMMLIEQSGTVHEIPGIRRPVYDVTGAGDTVIATLALACSTGANMTDAAMLANLAASRVVLRFGTSVVSPEELLEALSGAD